MTLTPCQRAFVDFVAAFTRASGYPPTYREIANGLGFRSEYAASSQARRLQRLGVVTQTHGLSRSIRIVPQRRRVHRAKRDQLFPVLRCALCERDVLTFDATCGECGSRC